MSAMNNISKHNTLAGFCWLGVSCLLIFIMNGCQGSSEQQLVGRWYSNELTIRFFPDGRVLMNSPAGRAKGTYYYNPWTRRSSPHEPVENLVLDVERGNNSLRLGYEVELISQERLRLYDLNRPPRQPPANLSNFSPTYISYVLKRAPADDTALMNYDD